MELVVDCRTPFLHEAVGPQDSRILFRRPRRHPCISRVGRGSRKGSGGHQLVLGDRGGRNGRFGDAGTALRQRPDDSAMNISTRPGGSARKMRAMSDQTITDVMRAHAVDAVAYAKSRFRMDLDLSSQSLERVDRILAAMYFDIPRTFFAKLFRRGPTDDLVWDWSKMWGGYVGEVIRKRWGGVWRSSLKPDGHAQISFDVLGQRYYPIDVMRRRLVEGRTKGKESACGAQEL